MEIAQRIKLLMEYDTKLTSSENTKIILETIPNWFKTLSKNVVDDVFNNLGGVLKTVGGQTIDNVDDLLKVASKGTRALDDVSKELFRNSILKNNTITLAQKSSFINTLVKNQVTINKYANNTNRQIFNKFKNAGYPDDVAQSIANKLKPTKTTPKPPKPPKPPVELGVLSDDAKALFGKINKKITPEQAAFLDDASEKIYNGVQKLNQKELLVLTEELQKIGVNIQKAIDKLNSSKNFAQQQKAKILQQNWDNILKQIKIITSNINKIPLWQSFKALVKTSMAVFGLALILGVFYTVKKTWLGELLGGLISNIENPFRSTNPAPDNGGGTTPETTPEDDLELFKKFIISDWKTDYREGYVTFRKEGNNYVANDSSVNQDFYYIKNNNTFQYVPKR